MAILASIAWLVLRIGDGRTSGLVGFVAGVSAAPGLMIAGAPFADSAHYPVAVLGSIPIWVLLGFVASRRSTRSPIASWSDYWRELLWLTIAVVLGAIGALFAATTILGESLIL